MPLLRALVVDITPERGALRHLLAAHTDVELTAEAGTLDAARQTLAAGGIDVVFLMLSLPNDNALSLLPLIPAGTRVITMTAGRAPMVRALRVAPADHLAKPVTPDALSAALDHVRRGSGAPFAPTATSAPPDARERA